MGNVRYHRNETVMPLRFHGDDVGPEAGEYGLEGMQGRVVGVVGRSEHPHRALEDRRIGSVDTVLLRTSHWVPWHETWIVDVTRHHCLDAAGICHQALCFGQCPVDLLNERCRRHCDERQFSIRVKTNLVDDTEVKRPLSMRNRDIGARYVPASLT